MLGNVAPNSGAKCSCRRFGEEESQIPQRSIAREGIKADTTANRGNETANHKGSRRKAGRHKAATTGDRKAKEGQQDSATVVWEFELGATLDAVGPKFLIK